MDSFTIIHEANDISKKLKEFTVGQATVPLLAIETLYVGFRKIFNNIYFEISTPNTTPAVLTATYDTATGSKALKICDETEGFTKSGYIKFDRPTDAIATTVAGEEKIFVHFKTDVDIDAGTIIDGAGIVFNTNNDLINIRSNIVSRLNDGKSLINKIELAKNTIIQMLNNQGNVKLVEDVSGSLETGSVLNSINEYDFLEIDQLRLASTYLAASLFYLEELSDEAGDKWEMQGKRHRVKFNELFQIYLLKLDLDDDGLADHSEIADVATIKLTLD